MTVTIPKNAMWLRIIPDDAEVSAATLDTNLSNSRRVVLDLYAEDASSSSGYAWIKRADVEDALAWLLPAGFMTDEISAAFGALR